MLKDNEQVYFKLRCRKFIEMVRAGAEMRTAMEGKRSNGHAGSDLGAQAMDLDANGTENGSYDRMDTEDSEGAPLGIDALEIATLQYGQTLSAEFKSDPRREVSKHLEDIFSLLAYANPLKEKDVAHLLDRKGRLAVAEELNSAILCEYFDRPPRQHSSNPCCSVTGQVLSCCARKGVCSDERATGRFERKRRTRRLRLVTGRHRRNPKVAALLRKIEVEGW